MGFFDDAEEPPEPRYEVPDRLYAPSGPGWASEPEQYYLPAVLPWTQELGRGEDAVVALRGVLVWPESCTLDVVMFLRRFNRGAAAAMRLPMLRQTYRLGVLFADGRRVISNSRAAPMPGSERGDERPILSQRGGSGGQFYQHMAFHLWPLPPDGPLTLVLDWSEQGIAETRTELDGTELRAKAADAMEIWHDLPPAPEGKPAGEHGLGFRSAAVRATPTARRAERRDPGGPGPQ
ncbi:MAG: hypothetical protein ACJ72N_04885 [Labedaea sp.]